MTIDTARLVLPRRRSFRVPNVVALVRVWFQRRHERLTLTRLDERMLRDIGITESMAREEAAKPFWRA
jgi:uncharacterized protein YjiS (DUF1127 family)